MNNTTNKIYITFTIIEQLFNKNMTYCKAWPNKPFKRFISNSI